ncbi:hypothetical protein [Fibrella forsythiae]|uniref:Glycosyltransferase RgtA/B/C/D-like domain-containing protein n=1 Tax=Fibrella forsythiae TaxID=2817061 RepID=A0ABS3JDH6_9BACT|nr:hypothetical protein [Fibrella forsythiae]MBO0948054.1 hypothetical protein [Fibrella forsythiae]
MKQDDGWLGAQWLLISSLIVWLTYINPTHYLSPDSTYYLSFAGWLVGLDGNQYGHVATGWDGTFPLGYPLLIGTLAIATGTSLLVASKLLNIVLTGVFLAIWRQRIGARRALWIGSLLVLGSSVRMLTYTWSEWAFLILLLEWSWFMSQPVEPIRSGRAQYRYVGILLLLTIGLFLLRYVGGYVVIVYGLMALASYRRTGWAVARLRIGADLAYGISMAAFMLGYFFLNSQLSTSPYGGERFYETDETIWEKVYLMVLAPMNELLLLRDYIPGEPALLVLVGLLAQVALIGWIGSRLKPQRDTLPDWKQTDRQWLRVLLFSAGTYLTLLFALRFISPFNGPNARLMAPATVPLLSVAMVWISRWNNVSARRQLGYWWAMFLLCSWLQLLPQVDLWEKLQRLTSTM